MQKVLGLDLGVGSIGWAWTLLPENEAEAELLDTQEYEPELGSRVVPYQQLEKKGSEGDVYSKGQAVTTSASRRDARGIRRMNDRYKRRRFMVNKLLTEWGMAAKDVALYGVQGQELRETLFGLRAKAAREQVTLGEIGRIFLWLNQKRGYLSNRKDTTPINTKSELLGNLDKNGELLAVFDENGVLVKYRTIGEFFL